MSRQETEAADKAVAMIESADQKIRWLGALMNAISTDIEKGDPDTALELSGLGAHLCLEWSSRLQGEVCILRRSLGGGEV